MSSFRRPAALMALTAILCVHPAGAPAQSKPQTVIRTETRLVSVDAIVRDKQGRFVRDISARDFRVWEDGKEQPISAFSLETSGRTPEASRNRYLAFLFDSIPISDQQRVRQDVAAFVSRYATADRYMAVLNVTSGIQTAQNFTTDAQSLQRAVVAQTNVVRLDLID